jgi:hypothetical protein
MMMKKLMLAGLMALALPTLALPTLALAAEMASPGTVPSTTSVASDVREVSLGDAKRAVRELLALAEERSLFVGEATRTGQYIKVQVTNLQGVPVKSFKVDSKTGEVVS